MGEEVVKGIPLMKPVACTIIVKPDIPAQLELRKGDDWNKVR